MHTRRIKIEQRNIRKVILLVSAGIGCSILLPFLLPFALGITVNVISLGIPLFVILCVLKNPWALDLLKRGRKGLVSLLGGMLPEVSNEEETETEPVTVVEAEAEAVETKEETLNDNDAESQKVISWYGDIGKKRLNQIISNLSGRGIYYVSYTHLRSQQT